MIFNQIKQKPLEYSILAIIFLISLVLFTIFKYNPPIQRLIIFTLITAYLAWSVNHHYKRGDLHFSIIVEYVVFITFALVILSSTLF